MLGWRGYKRTIRMNPLEEDFIIVPRYSKTINFIEIKEGYFPTQVHYFGKWCEPCMTFHDPGHAHYEALKP